MSVTIEHKIDGVQFVPVNDDDFTLTFESIPTERWIRDFSTSGNVVLPQEGYKVLKDHLNNVGVQQGIDYDIKIANQSNPFYVDLSQNVQIRESQASVTIKRFKSKDDIITNLENLTYEYLFQSGKITQADMLMIPFIVIRDNQAELLINLALTGYVLSNFIAESIATIATLAAELIAASTPSLVIPVGATINVGALIKYALLLILELAKLTLLIIALKELCQQFFDLIFPPIRKLKAMTYHNLIRIGLASQGLTYSSSLSNEFKKCTVIPVPIDEKTKKWWQLLDYDDDRILNRGYPTSSDTTPTVMNLLDEVCKMYNLQPYIVGNVVNLEPEGWLYSQPMTTLSNNFNDQTNLEDSFEIDVSGVWNTKIISYINDNSDKLLFDNPRGLRCEYKSLPISGVVINEKTKIAGYVDIRINFSLGTIKMETKLEKQLKKLAKVADKVLGTAFLALLQSRDGVLAISQTQFSVTKLIYQSGGKQLPNYVDKIGANSLYLNYHAVDDPKNSVYRNYSDMPLAMNNESFLGILTNNIVSLEGKQVEAMKADYVPRLATGTLSYRVKDLVFGKNIKTVLVYAE